MATKRKPRAAVAAPRPVVSARQRANARKQLEEAVEAAIALLDSLDGDCDLEEECEDEGAALEDEGCVEEDYDPTIEDEWPSTNLWAASKDRKRVTASCQAVIENVREVQRRKGIPPIPPLRVLADAIMKW